MGIKNKNCKDHEWSVQLCPKASYTGTYDNTSRYTFPKYDDL